MTEALKCPVCSAPLDAPADGQRTVQCPYCHSSVMISPPSFAGGASVTSVLGNQQALNDLIQTIRAGNKIQAIKIYRTLHNADLFTAKTAVERIAAKQLPGMIPPKPLPSSSSAGWIGLLVALVVAGSFLLKGLLMHHVTTTWAPTPMPQMPSLPAMPAMPSLPVAPPAPPAFATQVMEFGSEGIGPGQFKDARSIALDGAGHIYVAEYEKGRVQVFDSTGKFLKLITTDTQSPIMNIAANRDGTLLVIADGKITCYEGITGRSFGQAANTNGDAQESYADACFALTGDIYALDDDGNVIVLDSNGQIKKTIKARENSNDDSVRFDKIAVNGNGEIYTLSQSKGVFKFAADGRYINRFGKSDDDDPAQRRPDTLEVGFNIAIDGKGRVYVGDANPAIKVYDGSGRYIDSIGGNDVCFGVAITDQNDVLGCFRNKYCVRKYTLTNK
jgi:DNA-directed RNA polymerase subunit RPC12/RpoP